MNTSIFGTYDIRGKIPEDFSTSDALIISRAILSYFKMRDASASALVLGRDGRATSSTLAQIVRSIAKESGFTVHDLGLCPSPVLYHTLHTGLIPHGIMITASHNPASYNGFKIRCFKEPCHRRKSYKKIQSMVAQRSAPNCLQKQKKM